MEHLTGQYFLNSDLRPEEIREQIRELCRVGYEGIFLHARAGLKTPYFSKAWFDALHTAVDELIAHGVKFAIWDEDNYPSGDVGNRICNSFPELAASCLNFHIIEARKGVPVLEYFSENGAFTGCYAVDASGVVSDISEHCGTLRSEWGETIVQTTAYSPIGVLPYPHRRRSMNTPRYALLWTPEQDCRIVCVETLRRTPGRHCSDLLSPETGSKILELVHERYEKNFSGQMQHCTASFMDEPALSGEWPWSRSLPDEFKYDHGYDLLAVLPHLAMDIDDFSPRVRLDYRKTIGRMICHNYLQKVKNWLNARNIPSAGHLSRSENLSFSGMVWPNELRCFKYFDIPCCDPLGAGVGQPESIAHHIGIKIVSSAAHFFGSQAAGADAFAVGGDTISLRQLGFMLNYHLVMGITWFNIHGLYYTLDGERRDEAPPSLFYQHSQWRHMKYFLDHLKKRCEELAGEHLCNLAMLYPSTALQSRLPDAPAVDEEIHRTAEKLLSAQRDFELIDEETMLEYAPADFALRYPFFVISHCERLERKSAEWFEKYSAAGGKLFVEGVIPEILVETPGAAAEKWHFAKSCCCADYLRQIPAPAVAGNAAGNILLRKIRKDGRERVFLFNRGKTTFKGTLDGSAVELAPGEAAFADELQCRSELPQLSVDKWSLTFEANSVPLNWWRRDGGARVNLLEKNFLSAGQFAGTGTWTALFSVENAPEKLLFTTEETTLARGSFELNGVVLSGYSKADFRDCREVECDISSLVKPGRNIIKFNGSLFENPPFLRGNFKVGFPLGNIGCPEIFAAPERVLLSAPCDYSALGYGTFSGRALYEGKLPVPDNGRYALEFAFKDDSVKIVIDGMEKGALIAPPYRIETELSAGDHIITLEVCNAPGNRDVLAGLPAGMQS